MLAPAIGTQEVARQLTALLSALPREQVRLAPFEPGVAPRRVVAVDGSNVTVAESGSHVVGAYRCGRVELHDGALQAVSADAPRLALLSDHDATPLAHALREAGVTGVELPRLKSSAILEHLRTLAEMRCGIEALKDLDAGDLLLMDGALQARATLPLMDRLVERARARGVDVVGVCKSTSLTIGHTPALAACRLAARGLDAATWWGELAAPPAVRARVLVARLSRAESRPFRFDVAAADEDAPRVLPALAALAGHPAYPGYPSPLAMAHNAALLSEQERLRLRAQLHEAVIRGGVREDDWDAAFLDYHDVLELGA